MPDRFVIFSRGSGCIYFNMDMHGFDDAICFINSSCPFKLNALFWSNIRRCHPNFYGSWLDIGCIFPFTFHAFFLFSNENWSISTASVLPTSTTRMFTVKAQLLVVTHTVTEQSFRTHLPIDITWAQKPWALVFQSFSAKHFFFSVWWKTFISSTKIYLLVFQDKTCCWRNLYTGPKKTKTKILNL